MGFSPNETNSTKFAREWDREREQSNKNSIEWSNLRKAMATHCTHELINYKSNACSRDDSGGDDGDGNDGKRQRDLHNGIAVSSSSANGTNSLRSLGIRQIPWQLNRYC